MKSEPLVTDVVMRVPQQETTYPLTMGYLPEKFKKKARDELNEGDEQTIQSCLNQLRELIESDKNYAGIVVTDDYLLQYLRGRKYNIKKAFHVFRKFISFVKKHKVHLRRLSPGCLEYNATRRMVTFAPYRDKEGCIILYIKLSRWNPPDFHVDDIVRLIILILTHAVSDPMTQVNGFKVVFDFKCNVLKYIRYCTPYYAFLIYHGTQECLPARFKGIHIINPSLVYRTIWPVIVPFLPEKLKKRIHMHEHSPKLHNYLPDYCIPVEYGGQLQEYDFLPWSLDARLPECVKYIIGNPDDL